MLLILLATTLLAGCSNHKQEVPVSVEPINKRSADKRYAELQKIAQEHIEGWIKLDIEDVRFLKACSWKIDDEVFFNTKKDRAYLLLLIQDNDVAAELDYVYVLYAAQEQQVWTIYFAGLPSFVIPRERLEKGVKVSMDKLAEYGRQELRKGYFTPAGKINDTFVNETFSEELRRRHQEFLRKK